MALQAPAEEGGASAEDTVKKLQQAVATTPTDLEARHQLALKCFQLQRFEAAMNECLEVGVGRGGGEGGRVGGGGKDCGYDFDGERCRLRMKESEKGVWPPQGRMQFETNISLSSPPFTYTYTDHQAREGVEGRGGQGIAAQDF